MDKYQPELLRTKDLVMAELSIARYRIQEEEDKNVAGPSNAKTKSKSQNWDKWRALFELRSVSLIASAPKETDMDADQQDELLI
jgi:hypothetical protein